MDNTQQRPHGIGLAPLERSYNHLQVSSQVIDANPQVEIRNAEHNTPILPYYPVVTDLRQCINKMARVWKNVLNAMPNQLNAEHIQPNPVRTFRVLPSPQMGLTAVNEIDPNQYNPAIGM